MELRNKKTGEKVDAWSFYDGYQGINLKYFTDDGQINLEYRSLAELNKDWEDYEPKEPLIKDEKIRKAVRAWAEANNVTKVWHEGSSVAFRDGAVSIMFHELCWEEIPKGEYTIAELCGEEAK